MSSAEDAGCFTVTWEIANYSLLLESLGNRLRTSAWKTDTTKECAWWKLLEYSSGSDIVFDLFTLIGSTVLDQCQMVLIASCGEIPLKRNSNVEFSIEKNSILGDNCKYVFPNNTLTLCCKMWKKTMMAGEYRHYSVLHKLNYSWDNRESNSGNPTFFETNNVLQYISVQNKPEKGTHTIIIGSVPRKENSFSFVGCNLSINEGLGSVANKESIYPFVCWSCDIENFKEKNKGSGLRFKIDYIVSVDKNPIPQFFSSESSLLQKNYKILDSSGILSNDLLQIYEDKTFADATLMTEGKSFSAHRSILAARSPVFSAMFKKQMSEIREGVVDIEDLDSATLSRMLVFLYGDSLEEMNWEETSALYYAADKYTVPYLKQKCADVLKAGLALNNACQALILADRHSDQELMRCSIGFIRDHQEVISSDEWEKLEEDYPKLAAKSLREVFVKK